MAVKANRLIRHLVSRLPGATEEEVWYELLDCMVEACTDGWAYPVIHGPLTITAMNDGRFDLGADYPHWRIGSIINVVMNTSTGWGRALTPLASPPLAGDQTAPEPYAYWMPEPSTLQTFPRPEGDTANEVYVHMALAPDLTVEFAEVNPINLREELEVPEFFFGQHLEMWIAGVTGRMAMMPGKQFTSNHKSEYHLRRFRSQLSKSRDYARHQWSRGGNTWRYPAFANSGPFTSVWADPRIAPL